MGRQEEAPMLRLSHDQPSLWESVLPPEPDDVDRVVRFLKKYAKQSEVIEVK